MEHFAVGIVSLVSTLVFPLVYLAGLQLRRLGAWSKREKGPQDRIGFFLLVAAVFGFVVGSFAQPLWNKGVECRAAGQPLGACIFLAR